MLLHADILYLNKQRLVAVEELNKTNREKQSLLNKIEKLEAEKQGSAGKADHLMACAFVPHASYLVDTRLICFINICY